MKDFSKDAFSGLARKIGIVSLMAICFALFSASTNAQTLLVNYDFASAAAGTPCTATPITTGPAGVGSTFTTGQTGTGGTCTVATGTSAASPPAFVANSANQAVSLVNFSNGNTQYFQFQLFNVSSFQDYMIFVQLRGTSSGATSVTLQYSLDGTIFTNFSTVTTPTAFSSSTGTTFDLSSIAAIEGKSTVYFRLLGSNTAGTTGTTGTFNIDNFQVQATTIAAANTAPTISDIPNQSGTVGTPQTVNFTVGDAETLAGATVTATSSNTAVAPNPTVNYTSGNTTGSLTINPAATGTTTITVKVTDASGASSSDTFVLTVSAASTAPAITSANNTTFTQGTAGTFTVTATGTPTPTLSFTGTLPAGVTFTNNGNGTATIAGTPTTSGSFPITITASNGTAPDATQNFTLAVNAAPNPSTTVIVTAANPQGFRSIDTTGTGTVTFVVDPLAPAGVGSLQLSTPLATDKADFFHPTATLLVNVNELSYFTQQVSGSPAIADPAYQLRVCLNGLNTAGTACNPSVGGGSGFSTLVFEPYLNPGNNGNATIVPDVYQQYDVDAGLFYSTRTVQCSNGTLVGSQGSPLYTLAQIKATCPEAFVFDFGVNIGSNNAGYVVRTDLLNFNGTVFNFEPAAPTAAGVNLGGQVLSEDGTGIGRALLTLTGGNLQDPLFAQTDANGNYNFPDVEAGATYVLSVRAKGYGFNQANLVVNLNDDYNRANFTGTPKRRTRIMP